MRFGYDPQRDPPITKDAEQEAEAAMAQAREDREVRRLLAEALGPEPEQEGAQAK